MASTPERKINGRQRHIAVDTLGLLLAVMVTAASVPDRDGAAACFPLSQCRRAVLHDPVVWTDGGYAGRLITWAAQVARIEVRVLKRNDDAKSFEVLPRRWSWNEPWDG